MLENFQGDSWGSIPPLRMPSLLPHDLCHGWSASRWLSEVIEFQLSYSRSSLNMQCAGSQHSAFSKSSLNIWKFTVHVLLKPRLENFEHYFVSMWDECNFCVVVWTFFGLAFLWDWNENWPFSVLWPLLSFLNLLAYWVQHFHSIIFQDLKELNWNSITSTSFCS